MKSTRVSVRMRYRIRAVREDELETLIAHDLLAVRGEQHGDHGGVDERAVA